MTSTLDFPSFFEKKRGKEENSAPNLFHTILFTYQTKFPTPAPLSDDFVSTSSARAHWHPCIWCAHPVILKKIKNKKSPADPKKMKWPDAKKYFLCGLVSANIYQTDADKICWKSFLEIYFFLIPCNLFSLAFFFWTLSKPIVNFLYYLFHGIFLI